MRSCGRRGRSDNSSKTRCSPANRPRLFSGRQREGGTGEGGHQAQGFAEGRGRSCTAVVVEKDRGREQRCCREGGRSRDAAGETRLRFSWLFCFLFFATITTTTGSRTSGVPPRGRPHHVRGAENQHRFRGQSGLQRQSMRMALDSPSCSLSSDLHEMSLNIDMKMLRPVNFSGVTLNLDSNSWTLWQSCTVENPGNMFHSDSIGSPSILS